MNTGRLELRMIAILTLDKANAMLQCNIMRPLRPQDGNSVAKHDDRRIIGKPDE